MSSQKLFFWSIGQFSSLIGLKFSRQIQRKYNNRKEDGFHWLLSVLECGCWLHHKIPARSLQMTREIELNFLKISASQWHKKCNLDSWIESSLPRLKINLAISNGFASLRWTILKILDSGKLKMLISKYLWITRKLNSNDKWYAHIIIDYYEQKSD